MSQTSTLKGQCIAEFLGTGLLIFFGVGCVAALKVAGATFGQWEISVIWGLGVAMAIYLTAGVSGAHLNPAVTIALWLFACFDKRKVVPFIISQVAGAFCAAALVYGLYYNLFVDFEQTHHIVRGSVESLDLAGIFSTYPNPHINFVQAFAVEMVITAILMGLILALTDAGPPRHLPPARANNLPAPSGNTSSVQRKDSGRENTVPLQTCSPHSRTILPVHTLRHAPG